MIKQIFLVKRRSDLTFEQFKKHYLEVHAPLVINAIPEIRKYVVNFALQRGKETLYDAITELYWPNIETIIKIAKSNTFSNVIAEDEKNFSARLGHVLLTEEMIQKGAEEDGTKLVKQIFLNRRKTDLTFDQFKKHYLEIHAPLVKNAFPEIRKYVINFALQRGKETLYDGVTHIYWPDIETIKKVAKSSDTLNKAVAEDDKKFSQILGQVILTEETIQKG
jgi:uncharacterized protein (TIGR02118 family)